MIIYGSRVTFTVKFSLRLHFILVKMQPPSYYILHHYPTPSNLLSCLLSLLQQIPVSRWVLIQLTVVMISGKKKKR